MAAQQDRDEDTELESLCLFFQTQNILPSLREGKAAGRCSPTPCLASSLLDAEAQREEPQVISRPRNASLGSPRLESAAFAVAAGGDGGGVHSARAARRHYFAGPLCASLLLAVKWVYPDCGIVRLGTQGPEYSLSTH